MKRILFLSNIALLLCLTLDGHAQPTQNPAIKTGAAPKKAKKGALKHAEAVLGKPLTSEQTKAVRAAGIEQKKAMKPIREKYRVAVARALGLTLTQYDVREKALAPKRKQPKN